MLSGSRLLSMAFPGVVGLLDSGVRDFEPVRPLRPFVEVFSAIHQELQVIETRSEFAERFPRMLVVTNKAKNELTMRLKESDGTEWSLSGSLNPTKRCPRPPDLWCLTTA